MAATRSARVKTLLIVRHAHRDKPMGGRLDNGLSRKGKAQAALFAKLYCAGKIVAPARDVVLLSSPKRRCVQTLEPLARKLGKDIVIDESLNEGLVGPKVEAFYRHWKSLKASLVVINTHGDWIPEFFERYLQAKIELKKGAWAVVVASGSELKVTLRSRPRSSRG